MLIYPAVTILWMVVTSRATPPLGYVKTNENDKSPPSYRYKYTVNDHNGSEQGKFETRSGELANGQYYVNGEQSSTDVKYFADEWGYHPLVKYSASNSHSVASTQLALGENAVNALVNNTNFERSRATQRQLSNGQSPSGKNYTTDTEETTVDLLASASTESNHINNTSGVNLEQFLVIDTAGSFGQRLPEAQSTQSHRTVNTDAYRTPVGLSDSQSSIYHITTTPKITVKNSTENFESVVYNYKAALDSIRNDFGLNSDHKINDKAEANFNVFEGEFSGITLQDETNSSKESSDNSHVELLDKSVTSVPQVSPRFTKPIVVAEVPNYERFEYSTTFPCSDVDDETSGSLSSQTAIDVQPTTATLSSLLKDNAVLVTPKFHSQSRITTSSVVLNPIQAGVALINAGKAHLISSDAEMPLEFAGVNENVNNEGEMIHPVKGIADEEASAEQLNVAYDSIKSKFNGNPESTNTKTHTDQTFEIQKSHEIYHNAPVLEIHYPGELASQVVNINQLPPGYLNMPVYENSKVLEQRNTYTDIGNGNFEYQSIVDRPDLLLQELQTSPEGSAILYHSDSEEENNTNNLENFVKSTENYVTQANTQPTVVPLYNNTGEINFSSNTRTKLSQSYSPFELKELPENSRTNTQHAQVNIESVVKQENTNKDNAASSLKSLLAEEKQQHEYAEGTHIISSTVSPTEIEIKRIPSEIEKPESQYTLSKDLGKNTIYIHGPTVQGLPNNIGNYVGQNTHVQLNSPGTDTPVVQNLQTLQQGIMQIYPVQDDKNIGRPLALLQQYPVTAEKIFEEKLPYPLQKLVPQPYPVQILQPYPVERAVEKPLHVPNVEKMIEKKNHVPKTYITHVPVKLPYSVDLTKYIENSINLPYGVQYGVSYQQIMNPQIQNLYESNPINHQLQTNASNQDLQGYYYDKPLIPLSNSRFPLTKRYGSLNQLQNNKLQQQPHQQQSTHAIYPKKIHFGNQLILPLHSRTVDYQMAPHRHLVYRNVDKLANKNQEYFGPLPLPQHALNLHQQNQAVHPVHQETLRYLATVARSIGSGTNLRRTRLPETHYHSRTSNFRQSKMEYGFKPPMVPSVQYDEQTATRVDN